MHLIPPNIIDQYFSTAGAFEDLLIYIYISENCLPKAIRGTETERRYVYVLCFIPEQAFAPLCCSRANA